MRAGLVVWAWGTLVTALLGAPLTLAAPPTEVEDPGECVDAAQLRAEIDRIMPEGPGPDAPITVRVRVLEGALALRIEREEGAPLLERSVAIAAGDCAVAEQVLARIVVRRLQELSRDEWTRKPEPPGPKPTPEPPRWRGSVALGASIGLDRPEVRGDLGGRAGLRLAGALHLVGELRVGVSQAVRVGEGQARLTRLSAALGLGVDTALGAGSLTPQLAIAAGVQLAQGLGFDREDTATLPLVDARLEIVLRSATIVELALGVEVPIVATRLSQEARGERYRDPVARARIAVGVTF